jgi:hypothetical protein
MDNTAQREQSMRITTRTLKERSKRRHTKATETLEGDLAPASRSREVKYRISIIGGIKRRMTA